MRKLSFRVKLVKKSRSQAVVISSLFGCCRLSSPFFSPGLLAPVLFSSIKAQRKWAEKREKTRKIFLPPLYNLFKKS